MVWLLRVDPNDCRRSTLTATMVPLILAPETVGRLRLPARQRADRCAATAANNARRANRPQRRRFAHTRRVFAALRANRRWQRRFARSERSRWTNTSYTSCARRAARGHRAERLKRPSGQQTRARTAPQLVANPNRVHRWQFGALSIPSPPDEPKTANTAALWVAHHADPDRTPPPG